MNIQDVISDNLVYSKILMICKAKSKFGSRLRGLGYKLESLQSIKESEELNNDLNKQDH